MPSLTRLLTPLLIILGLILVTAVLPPPTFGENDLRAYWGASYLLRHGQSFTDYEVMQQLQRQQTNWPDQNGAMMTWNPPWLLVLFLPLSFFSYDHAVWLWFFSSMGLFFLASVWICKLHWPTNIPQRALASMIVVMLAFAPLWVNIAIGQISVLIFFGLAGYLYFQEKAPFLAGILLVFTTIKPHILFLFLPLALLQALWRRQWRLWAGFITFLLVSLIITFALRPPFIAEYLHNLTQNQAMLLTRPTPSLTNLVAVLTGQNWVRFVGLALLPIIIGYWWRNGRYPTTTQWLQTTAVLTLLSAVTLPYGYSFDFIALFMPITLTAIWLTTPITPPRSTYAILFAFITLNLLFMQQHTTPLGQFYLGWYPLGLAILFAWATWIRQITPSQTTPLTN